MRNDIPERLKKYPAKPVTYGGREYKSKLEAKWAVFFDEIKVKYIYEPETFSLRYGIKYRPDFALTNIHWRGQDASFYTGKPGQPVYVEVKGADHFQDLSDKEKIKIEEFACHYPLLVLGNVPWNSETMMDWRINNPEDEMMNFKFLDGKIEHCFFSVDRNNVWLCAPWDENNYPASIRRALNCANMACFDEIANPIAYDEEIII